VTIGTDAYEPGSYKASDDYAGDLEDQIEALA
jgi:hypothetical protein